MYRSYGDRNFFEHGVLVDLENSHSDFNIIYCRPFGDVEGRYLFAECLVDITDSWIDRKAVMEFAGMTESDFDPILFAIDCIEYYGAENFGAENYYYDYTNLTEYDIKEILRHRCISSENLDITW